VIAGQGTLGLEILDQLPDPEAIVAPVGGGGLIGGLACAVKRPGRFTLPMLRAHVDDIVLAGAQALEQAAQILAVLAERGYAVSRSAGQPARPEARSLLARSDGHARARVPWSIMMRAPES
jgi:threonine dehydratase